MNAPGIPHRNPQKNTENSTTKGEMERLAGAGAGGVATGWLGGATCVDFLHFLFEATTLLPCFFLHFLASCAMAEAPPLAGSDRPIVQASVATNTS